MHIGIRTVLRGIALQHRFAQGVHAVGHVHRVALGLHGFERVEDRLEDRQVGRAADVASVGREVEDHQRHLALPALAAAQADQPVHARGQHLRALGAGGHVLLHIAHAASRTGRRRVLAGEGAAVVAARAGDARPAGPAAKDGGAGGAVQLGDGHHDGALHRQQAALGAAPLVQGLEFHRVRRDVGHVQLGQDLFGRLGVVVRRPANEGEARQRHHGVHRHPAVLDEEALDGRTRVQPGGKCGHHFQAASLQGGDDAVVVPCVAAQQVGAQQQQAHRALGAGAARCGVLLGARWAAACSQGRGQGGQLFGQSSGHAGVVHAHFGVVHRCRHLGLAAQAAARAVGVAVNHKAHHVQHVLVGAAEPVLHGQEVGAHVLRRARDEAQHLGQPPQHLHLRSAARGGLALAAALAAQLLQQRHGPAGGLAHVEGARLRELDHLAG